MYIIYIMEQRCEIILQNYLQNQEYNNDYKIVNDIENTNNYIIYYKSNKLFQIYKNNYYIKYNIYNVINKEYDHNKKLLYYNNKNNRIVFKKTKKIYYKLIVNNKDFKYYIYIYNKFFQIYKKMIKNHLYFFIIINI